MAPLEALKRLVEKLEKIEESDEYRGVWAHYLVHGFKYRGPNYKVELEQARAAIAAEGE